MSFVEIAIILLLVALVIAVAILVCRIRDLATDIGDSFVYFDESIDRIEDGQISLHSDFAALQTEFIRATEAFLKNVEVQHLIVEHLLIIENQACTPEEFAKAIRDIPVKLESAVKYYDSTDTDAEYKQRCYDLCNNSD